MSDTATEPQTEELCSICGEEPRMGKLGKFKMKEIGLECITKMRDEGNCPMCRGVGVLTEDPEHMQSCKGKLPKQKQDKPKRSGKSKKELDLEEERKVQEAQERLNAKRARRDAPVKNIRDMNLEELQQRLTGTYIDVRPSVTGSKTQRIQVKSVVALKGDDIELVDAGKAGAVRTIDRTKVEKIGR